MRQSILRGLGFSPELQSVYRAGVQLRDTPNFPGRKYFLAHSARELRNQLAVHIREYHRDPVPTWQRERRTSISQRASRRWVAEISPLVNELGGAAPAAERTFEVSAEIVLELDPHMNRMAALESAVRDRMIADLRRLQRFVPSGPLERATKGLANADATRYAHVRSLGNDFSDSEVLPMWDELEQLLFELVGSAAWAYNSIDELAAELNAL